MKKKILKKVLAGVVAIVLMWSSMLPVAADSAEYAQIFEQVMNGLSRTTPAISAGRNCLERR